MSDLASSWRMALDALELAWCPICELPRARLLTITFLGSPVTISSCPCVTKDAVMLPDGIRAIPMTHNHDPGDEDRSVR